MRFTAATFNLRNGLAFDGWNSWPFRRSSTAQTIRALGADIIGLQEAYRFQLRWLRRRLPEFHAAGSGRSRRRLGEHCPVLVRTTRARIVSHRTLWYGDRSDVAGTRLEGALFPRIATVARVRFDEGVEIEVVSTHLDERSPARRRASASHLARQLDGHVPRVVLGDLNAETRETLFDVLAEHGLRPVPVSPDVGTVHGFTGGTAGRRIDHILVSDDIEIVDAAVVVDRHGGRLPSDHWPVVADLTVT